MATKTKTDPTAYEFKYKKDYQEDWMIHRNYVQTFDPYEAMLIGLVFDSVSNSVDGSKITDSYAATLAIERAARVMGKLPDGVTESMGKADMGKAAFMDILRQKWVYPNANAQHKFDTKLRLWQLYSTVYGYMPMFYDWNVSTTGYVGPDCWLWNPRNLVPQQGRTSIADMDHVTALTWVSKAYLQDMLEDAKGVSESQEQSDDAKVGVEDIDDKEAENKTSEGGWDVDALQLLIQVADNEKTNPDAQKDTQVERTRIAQATRKGICLATRYEAGEDGRWITFAPDHGNIQVRDIENPHKNGKIPFVIKYSQPLYDSFYGLGDFQRAKPLQFARDGLTNFYFKGIKMNLVPPLIANANGVMKHTLDYREGAVMLETIPNSIRRLDTSTAGLATYQAAQTSLTGSLLSLYGSQNASIPGSDANNPSIGKTPAAIDLYQGKEADRDGQERMYLESAIEELTDGMFDLIVNIGTETVPVGLFSDDIKEIVDQGLADVLGIFEGSTKDKSGKFQMNETQTGGQLKIDPTKLQGIDYRFNINAGSTAKINNQMQLQQFQGLVGDIAKFQNLFNNDARYTVHWDKILATEETLSEIPGAGEFVTFDSSQPSPQQMEQQQQQQEAQQAQQAAQAPSPNAVQMPGGQIHEQADLAQIYTSPGTPEDIRRQIEHAMGFQPSQVPVGMNTQPNQGAQSQPMPTPQANDPVIAAAMSHIGSLAQPTPTPKLQDPEIAQAAQQLSRR